MIINYKFKRRNTIDYNEIKAANKVLKKEFYQILLLQVAKVSMGKACQNSKKI